MAGPRMKTEVMFSHRKHLFSKGPVNHSIFKNPGLAAWWMNCSFYAATFEQNGSHYWHFNPYVCLTWGGESLYWCSLKSIKITHFPRKTIVSLRFMSAKHMFFLRRKTYHHILFFFPLVPFPPCSFWRSRQWAGPGKQRALGRRDGASHQGTGRGGAQSTAFAAGGHVLQQTGALAAWFAAAMLIFVGNYRQVTIQYHQQ